MNIILIVGIIAAVLGVMMKKGYQTSHFSYAVKGGFDKTPQMLNALHEKTNNYVEYIDVFEASITGLMFTNVGIVYGDNAEEYIPYEEIQFISEPAIAVINGAKQKSFREIEVHTNRGIIKMLYSNSKDNTFLTMIREFNSTKYPKRNYEGYRGRL